ncbi:MAG TPA: TonB-dependent receptor [Caulobacteraceae bacterium]|jgi:outer membrane receptor protein involved in Fe transport|nr:TonB-dependent receptor [Caulobacteraceae bacterium]
MKTALMSRFVGVAPAGVAMLLASTCLTAGPARAAEASTDTVGPTAVGEVIVTATKRAENIQKVPMSITAIDARRLSELNVTNFQDYVKFVPTIQYETFAPSVTTIYMRGVADGGNGNHSGPLPSVGAYLDELPITTIGGTIDVHVYDLARVEVLPGPQGTLYGASSESGTLRLITNTPDTSHLYGALNAEGNWVDHGSEGYVVEGFVNVPVTDHIAVRLVAFDERDAGFIDNVLGERAFVEVSHGVPGPVDGIINNAGRVKSNFNPVETYGGRLAVKFDLGDNWTITPQVIAQDMRADGIFGFNPAIGDLKVNRFQPDSDHDRWVQAGLTINGKIGKYDLTYAGGYFKRWINSNSDYTDYSVAYDQASGYGSYWTDANGVPLSNPAQFIVGRDRFEKGSNELRLASPATDRFRFLVGLFQERQTHWIIQDYLIQGLGPQISVPGWPHTWWLTDQDRVDSDRAVFGEVSFDVTPRLTITAGARYYGFTNSLYGFFGFNDPAFSSTGTSHCIAGLQFRDAPCVDLNGVLKGTGETHKVNATYHLDDTKLVYFTYSTGYRPGGFNRNSQFGAYNTDNLSNYEIGWKTSWFDRSLVWNGAAYYEDWSNFQFAYLGTNSLTVVVNAPSARILGVESNVEWRATEHLTLAAAMAYNDAVLAQDFCTDAHGTVAACEGNFLRAPKGQQLPYTPKFNGNFTARYTFPFMGWNAHAQVAVAYQSSRLPAVFSVASDAFASDVANLGKMPGYATVDFSIGAEHDKSSVELFVKNAFDERGQINRYTPCTTSICAPGYPAGVGSDGTPYPATPPAVYVVPIQPLTIGIRLGQKF